MALVTYSKGYGRVPDPPDHRDFRARASRRYTGAFVDLTSGFPDPAYDQESIGSCTAQGSCAALDFARVKMGLAPLAPPSRLFVYYQTRVRGGFPTGEDTGANIRNAFDALHKDGAPPEGEWPYDTSRFADKPPAAAYTAAELDQAVRFGAVTQGSGVDDMIASGYPVVFGFDVYESFESDALARTGVMTVPTKDEAIVGGHCVTAVSTPRDGAEIPGGVPGVRYRRCRNSWGTGWGDSGYFWMPLAVMDGQQASDFWQVTTVEDPSVPVPPEPAGVAPFLGATEQAAARLARLASRRPWGGDVTAYLNWRFSR